MSESTSKGRPVGQVNKILLLSLLLLILIAIFIVIVIVNIFATQVAPAQRSTDAPGGVSKQAEGGKVANSTSDLTQS